MRGLASSATSAPTATIRIWDQRRGDGGGGCGDSNRPNRSGTTAEGFTPACGIGQVIDRCIAGTIERLKTIPGALPKK